VTRDSLSEAEYDSWAAYYNRSYDLPTIVQHINNQRAFIEVCQQYCMGKRLLEIGTGTGLVAIYLSQAGFDVTGLDYDLGVLGLNRRLNHRFEGNVNLVQGDMFGLPFSSGAVDLGYHQGLLEHFDPPEIIEALQEQLRVCRRIVFSVPTVRWTGGLIGNERLLTGSQWIDMLRGFRILDVFGGAYSGAPARLLDFTGRRLTKRRPRWLHQALARHQGGEIGLVLESA